MPSHQEVIEKLIQERDEARAICRRMREFFAFRITPSAEGRARFNALCHEITWLDWMQDESLNPDVPPEHGERLQKREAGPG